MRFHYIFILALWALLMVACSGTNGIAVIEPGMDDVDNSSFVRHHGQLNRYTWGFWQVCVSEDHQSAEIVPMRIAEMHLNCVRLLEVTPCSYCLTISVLDILPNNEIIVDLTLRHPYPGNLNLTGFDVRGIFISGAEYMFPISGRNYARGDDVPRMLNPDGYTQLFNPTEFPETNPPALGYITGEKATGGDLSATLNPFVAYRQDQPRCMWEPGIVSTESIHLYVPDGPIEFGYAVDACWQLVEEPIDDPLVDFPPDANCLEAYRVNVDVGNGLHPTAGNSVPIQVEVFDHQGFETISIVTMEAGDLFEDITELDYVSQTSDESWLFEGLIENILEAEEGFHPLLVRVVDTETDQNLGAVDSWNICEVRVQKYGWAQTWGGTLYDFCAEPVVDHQGNIYVTGLFRSPVDFDPGLGVTIHTPEDQDIYLSKFNSLGDFMWVRTWGDEEYEWGAYMEVDDLGNVYIAGDYQGLVDFDPGNHTDMHESNGESDIFICKYNPDGEFQWARTWGSDKSDWGMGVDTDSEGNVFVTGCFWRDIDFDPGSGTDIHATVGKRDIFLSKFDTDGNFQWAHTWGGTYWGDFGYGVAVDPNGGILVGGKFSVTVDFDPGPGVEEYTVDGGGFLSDCFLSKFDTNGNFLWANTWGAEDNDECWSVAVDGMANVYAVGNFRYLVDFDPGPGVTEITPVGIDDVFMCKFDQDGEFQWVRSWGGDHSEWGRGVVTDDFGYVYASGTWRTTIDFDPGPGVTEHSTVGDTDVFLSKFNTDGDFIWVRTWGGVEHDRGNLPAVDSLGNVFVTGAFYYDVNFDPGSGTDWHTSHGSWDSALVMYPPDGNW